MEEDEVLDPLTVVLVGPAAVAQEAKGFTAAVGELGLLLPGGEG